ncbi:MAG: pilus assembly PilX N-terminal domain-containing protein [Vicinamibacterales bacterium]
MALVIALMCMILMLALGTALIVVIDTETRISSHYQDSAEALYAADAGVEWIAQDLLGASDWNSLLNGSIQSGFIDGAPSGTRPLSDGTTLDLAQVTNLVRCGEVTTCSDASMDAVTAERPWGANNPRWQPYAYGPLSGMLPNGMINARTYLIVWVADDPSESDGKPFEDGGLASSPGRGVLAIRAHAYGPSGSRRMVEATVARIQVPESGQAGSGLRVLSWREIR